MKFITIMHLGASLFIHNTIKNEDRVLHIFLPLRTYKIFLKPGQKTDLQFNHLL